MVVKTVILIYPIIKELGLGVTSPVALVVDSVNIAKYIVQDLYGVTSAPMYSTSLSEKEMREHFTELEYELVAMAYVKSQNSIPNLQFMQAACQAGTIRGQVFSALPIVIFPSAIAQEAMDYLSGQICITLRQSARSNVFDDDSIGIQFSYMLIQYVCSKWTTVQLELTRLLQNEDNRKTIEDNQGSEMFLAAEKILELLLESQDYYDKDINPALDRYRNALNTIINQWQFVPGGSAWIDILQKLISKAAAAIPGIIDRNHAEASVVSHIDDWPLYDDEYYYLSSQAFNELCSEITPSISINEIKRLLIDHGILEGEGRERLYMTAKVPVTTEYGAILEPRKLRLHREWLDLDCSLTWREMIENNCSRRDE